jgi:predicted lipoprotein
MKRNVKYIAAIFCLGLIIFLSLDVRNLDEYRASATSKAFDASSYARQFWEEGLPAAAENAPDVKLLVKLVDEDPETAFEMYGHKLGISKTFYFMVKGSGKVKSVEDEFLVVDLGEGLVVKIATAFIFGNAVRDGSGIIDIDDFQNMTDFNYVSVAINKLVKEGVANRLKKTANLGKHLEFAGAVEIREGNINIDSLRIVPVSVKISNGRPN